MKNPFDQSVQCLESFIPLAENTLDENSLDILVMNGKKNVFLPFIILFLLINMKDL